MNKFLRVLFILVIVAMLGASVLQIFLPSYMGEHSGYGISAGWQREIGIWNLAVLIIILAVNIKYDWFYLRIVLLALIIGLNIILLLMRLVLSRIIYSYLVGL